MNAVFAGASHDTGNTNSTITSQLSLKAHRVRRC